MEDGAVLRFQSDRSHWRIRPEAERANGFPNVHLVNAVGAEDVFIRGGMIDGDYRKFYDRVYFYETEQVLEILRDLYESGWRIWYDEGLTIGDRYDETLEAHQEGLLHHGHHSKEGHKESQSTQEEQHD